MLPSLTLSAWVVPAGQSPSSRRGGTGNGTFLLAMPNYLIEDQHEAYLSRTSRRLSLQRGALVSKRAVLQALLDLAIQDEAKFDPETPGQVLGNERRELLALESESSTARLTAPELLNLISSSCSQKTD